MARPPCTPSPATPPARCSTWRLLPAWGFAAGTVALLNVEPDDASAGQVLHAQGNRMLDEGPEDYSAEKADRRRDAWRDAGHDIDS